MSKIYGKLKKESREVMLGDDEKLDCEIKVGTVKDNDEFVKVWVGIDKVGFNAEMNVYCNKRGFELFASTDDDTVIVKSMLLELNDWMEDADYEEIIGVLDELKGLKATLCAYLEDISRISE